MNLLKSLPVGDTLDDEMYERRQRVLERLLVAHIPLLLLLGFTVADGVSTVHVLAELSVVMLFAFGVRLIKDRALTTIATSIGWVTAAALLIHNTNGVIEAHFYWFVVVGVVGLYHDVRALGPTIVLALAHHLVMAAIDPDRLFSYLEVDPFSRSIIHAVAVVLLVAVLTVTWMDLMRQTAKFREASAELDRLLSESQKRTAVAQAEAENMAALERQAAAQAERSTLVLERTKTVMGSLGGLIDELRAVLGLGRGRRRLGGAQRRVAVGDGQERRGASR